MHDYKIQLFFLINAMKTFLYHKSHFYRPFCFQERRKTLYFYNRFFPKVIFPSGPFQGYFLQRKLPNSVLAAALRAAPSASKLQHSAHIAAARRTAPQKVEPNFKFTFKKLVKFPR